MASQLVQPMPPFDPDAEIGGNRRKHSTKMAHMARRLSDVFGRHRNNRQKEKASFALVSSRSEG